MKKKKKVKTGKIVAIIATILGFVLGGLFSFITQNWLIFVVFGLFALAEAVVVRFVLELEIKKLASRFTDQMQKN